MTREPIELLDDLADQVDNEFGLGPDADGVLASGGSLANLHALSVARSHAFDVHITIHQFELQEGGRGLPSRVAGKYTITFANYTRDHPYTVEFDPRHVSSFAHPESGR